MNAAAMTMVPELRLPWEASQLDDARYRRILSTGLAVFLVLAVLVPLLPVPELTRQQRDEVPAHLARVILEKKALPEPVAVEAPAPAKPKPVPRIEPEPVARPQPVVKPEIVPDAVEQARAVAATSGVLAFADSLQEMRESVDVDALANSGLSRGAATADKLERSVISANAAANSGGISVAAASHDSGGAALSSHATTRVAGPVSNAPTAATTGRQAAAPGRSDEAIRRVMDSKKGGIFAVYNRALRRNSLLQGKLVFEMVIDASGSIADISLLSSELEDPQLTKKILARIRMINFGAADVATTRVNYSFDFLPY